MVSRISIVPGNVDWGTQFIVISAILFAALVFAAVLYLGGKKVWFVPAVKEDKIAESHKKWDFGKIALLIFIAAALLRLILSVSYFGHSDVTFFRYWVGQLLRDGFSFYINMTPDSYLPGYMYILYLLGGIAKLLGIGINSEAFVVMLKIPAILCDILCSYILFRFLKKHMRKEFALALSILYLFNPAIILDSALWGQVDSFTALFTILSTIYIFERKYFRGFASIALGLAFKLQFAFILPVLGAAVLIHIIEYIKDKQYKKIYGILYGLLICIGTFLLVILPFSLKFMLEGDIFFILKVYSGQVGNFNYFVLNTFNIYGMLGLNWVTIPDTLILGFLSYNALNYLLIALMSVICIVLYILGKNAKNIFLLSSYLILLICTFSVKMHERYMITALAPLLIACAFTKDRRLITSFAVFSILQLLNSGVLLFKDSSVRYYGYGFNDSFFVVCSNLWVFFFLYFSYVVFDIVIKGRKAFYSKETAGKTSDISPYNVPSEESSESSETIEQEIEIPLEKDIRYFDDKYEKLKASRKMSLLGKKDGIIMVAFALIYFLVNLINLGGTNVPQTFWEVEAKGNSAEFIILEIPADTIIGEIWGYKGIDADSNTSNSIKVYAADTINIDNYLQFLSEGNYKGYKKVSNNGGEGSAQMYKWFNLLTLNKSYRYVAFSCDDSGVRINEIVLLEKDTREIIDYSVLHASTSGELSIEKAFDERETCPKYNSLMTDMYFDEIYHARTAYEHIMGWEPYEITHPPLGKIIISLGIRVFGMNPFGWRISGVLFASLLLPIIYAIGRQLFKSRRWSVLFTLLMSLDGLHFVQGRIATIDTYIVFFSSVSMLFMIIFMRTNILRDGILKCLLPFALSGIFFGLALSSKWTGLYTGAGLFVMLLIYVFRMINEYRYTAAEIYDETKVYKKYSKTFDKKLIYILLTGIIFFVVIPAATYVASYLPYMTAGSERLNILPETRSLIKVMLDNQKYMFSYHSEWVVETTHQCESPWYSWLINFKSVYMYYADSSFGENMYARIHSIGNPFIAWAGFAALIYCIYRAFDRQIINLLNRVNMAKREQYIEIRQKKETGEITIPENKFRIRQLPSRQDSDSRETLMLIFIGFLAALLPWTLVERSTFIYHFYPAMPYYCAMIIIALRAICAKFTKKKKITLGKKTLEITSGGLITGIYIFACCLMFAMMFPVYAGIPVSKGVASVLFLWLRLFTASVGF